MLTFIHWQDFRRLNYQQLPYSVRPWLLDRRSLTARLIEASNGDFRVERISQGWQVPTLDEALLLKLKPRQKALVREVLLYCHNEPWVYARSVIPPASLAGSLRFLRKLKNSALGSLLFKDPHLQRSPFAVAAVQLSNLNIPVDSDARVFGRRSLFHLYQQPLLVAEIFLPACKLDGV
jgi:chorismate lyase